MNQLPATPALLVVIHLTSPNHASVQAEIALSNGADGIWLINHFHDAEILRDAVVAVRERVGPNAWIGINPLDLDALRGAEFVRTLQGVDGLWCDDAGIVLDAGALQPYAESVLQKLRGWGGAYFGGVAFKYQREVPPEDEELAALISAPWMSVVCTSGVGTGRAADLGKLERMARGSGITPLAVASGISIENAVSQLRFIDFGLAATSISTSETELDPAAVAQLAEKFAQARRAS